MNSPLSIELKSPEETSALAAQLGGHLEKGDVLLLEGEIGSGKTHFSRALIQSAMDVVEDVPSPTYTLVQVYDTRIGEVWHSDLYRLSAVEEVDELGLTDAFETAITLVEWPEKLEALTPPSALVLRFKVDPDRQGIRHLDFSWSDPKWPRKLKAIQ